MSSIVTYKYIQQNPDIRTYIKNADAAVEVQGYTEHSFAHVEKTAASVELILSLRDSIRNIESLKLHFLYAVSCGIRNHMATRICASAVAVAAEIRLKT